MLLVLRLLLLSFVSLFGSVFVSWFGLVGGMANEMVEHFDAKTHQNIAKHMVDMASFFFCQGEVYVTKSFIVHFARAWLTAEPLAGALAGPQAGPWASFTGLPSFWPTAWLRGLAHGPAQAHGPMFIHAYLDL